MMIGGETLDLRKVTIPIYDLAAREDHIAPARSVFTGAKYFGGPVRYVLAGSGHIAGVVNPRRQAQISVSGRGGPPDGALRGLGRQAPRRRRAPGGRTGSPGSPRRRRERVPARELGAGKLKPIATRRANMCA